MALHADARVAAYYAPAADDPLWQAGSRWIGRDAVTGARLPQPAWLQAITASACGYGFHATLRAPILLRPGIAWADMLARTRRLACQIAPFPLPPLQVGDHRGFMALMAVTESAPLRALADRMVIGLDDLRPPIAEAEQARRRATGLSAAQEANLARWGYPDVLDTWRFHMTLSQKLTAEELARRHPVAAAFLAEACAVPRRVEDVCLFVQPGYKQPFRLAERVRLG